MHLNQGVRVNRYQIETAPDAPLFQIVSACGSKVWNVQAVGRDQMTSWVEDIQINMVVAGPAPPMKHRQQQPSLPGEKSKSTFHKSKQNKSQEHHQPGALRVRTPPAEPNANVFVTMEGYLMRERKGGAKKGPPQKLWYRYRAVRTHTCIHMM